MRRSCSSLHAYLKAPRRLQCLPIRSTTVMHRPISYIYSTSTNVRKRGKSLPVQVCALRFRINGSMHSSLCAVAQHVIAYCFFFLRVPSHATHMLQSIVLEPCSRLIVQINEAIDLIGWSVDGAASSGDMVCRLFGTTVISVNCHSCTIPNCIVRLRFRIAICVFVHKETML